jgi:hypothetical protein
VFSPRSTGPRAPAAPAEAPRRHRTQTRLIEDFAQYLRRAETTIFLIERSDTMMNILETTKTTALRALQHLGGVAASMAATLAGGYQPGEAHLAGPSGAAGLRSSTIDEDLDVLLHEIQRRRSRA